MRGARNCLKIKSSWNGIDIYAVDPGVQGGASPGPFITGRNGESIELSFDSPWDDGASSYSDPLNGYHIRFANPMVLTA